LAIVVNEIRLIDAAALPILVRFKHRRRLIHPFTPIPFEIADRIRTQHIRRTAGVIDSLDRRSPLRIPSHHVRRAVPSSSYVPVLAPLISSQARDPGLIIGNCRNHPPSGRERRILGQRRAEQIDALTAPRPAGKIHPPAIAPPGQRGVGQYKRVRNSSKSISRIENLGYLSWHRFPFHQRICVKPARKAKSIERESSQRCRAESF